MSKYATKSHFRPEFSDLRLVGCAKRYPWTPPLEINSGAIELLDEQHALFDVQANTTEGLWDLYGISKSDVAENELSEFLEGLKRRQRKPSLTWSMRTPSIVIRPITPKTTVAIEQAEGPDSKTTDPQFIASTKSSSFQATDDTVTLTADELLHQLSISGANVETKLLCAVELALFATAQQEALLPLLWQYILAHRDSNNRDELVATGAAIRKYIAIMPMDRMGELAVLLESGHRSPLPIELEIEVAKMIFRNFEVHPPVAIDTQPELAERLLEMVHAYVHPRILLRDKNAAAASLAIEAIFAMRSSLAAQAWQTAAQSPYRWFAELVSDELDELHEKWCRKSSDAAAWLVDLRDHVSAQV